MEKRIKYGTTLLLFLIAALLIYGYIYHISVTNTAPAKADAKISARDLTSLAGRQESLFNQQYLYKTLSVGGVIRDIKKNKSGGYTLSLGGNADVPATVSCSLDSLYNDHPLSLKPGDSCSIRGIYAGQLTDVILVHCIIEK